MGFALPVEMEAQMHLAIHGVLYIWRETAASKGKLQ
jgi:hypothetical protein